MVEGRSEDWLLGFEGCLGRAKVAELGAGRVKEGRWEVFVRAMVVFCGSACGELRGMVIEDEAIVFGLHGGSELECSHGFNGALYPWAGPRLVRREALDRDQF